MVYRKIAKAFLKSEAQQDVKDGRIITTFEDLQKLQLAQFARPAAEHMKQFAWYGPGKKPIEIAQRMVQICAEADFVNESDFKRLDGTITDYLRTLDSRILLRMFRAYRAELNELLSKTAHNTVYLANEKYDQGPQQGSGCSLTSFIQTTRTAFCSYVGYRNIQNEYGYVYTPLRAFEQLGIHNGDDGSNPDLPLKNHLWAAKKLGLILVANVVERGHSGVTFLARYYSPQIWEGCIDSMCDIKRQLSKFHTTVRLPSNVQPEQKLVEKAMSYLATDANTPVLGEFCKQVLEVSSYRPQTPLGVGYWWGQFEQSVQYPNANVDNWMDVECERLFPQFDRLMFDNWLASTRSVKDLLSAPLCAEPVRATPSVPAVVDGEVVEPSTPKPDNTNTCLPLQSNSRPPSAERTPKSARITNQAQRGRSAKSRSRGTSRTQQPPSATGATLVARGRAPARPQYRRVKID
jgi:hypothetical protein